MRGLLKFTDIPDIELINSRQSKLSATLANKIFTEANFENAGEYLFDLINNTNYNTIAADFEVIKYLDTSSTIYLSSIKQDWYDEGRLIDTWFKAERPEYYSMDLMCEVISKAIIGNYFVVNLRVLDIGNILID